MLQLVLGISGTGKSSRLMGEIKQRARAGQKSILLVPEQFTSSTESAVYEAMGDELSGLVSSYSFRSLAEKLLGLYGGIAVRTLTDAGRAVLVRRALEALGGDLRYYHRHRRSAAFCRMCAETIDELKSAGLTGEQLALLSAGAGSGQEKLAELAAIFTAYEALLGQSAMDPGDRLLAAARRTDPAFFADTAVFVDEFDTFNASKKRLIELMLTAAPKVTVALCCDGLQDYDDGLGLFSGAKAVANSLIRLARNNEVPCAAPVLLEKDLRHGPELAALNRLLALPGFAPEPAPAAPETPAAPAAPDAPADPALTLLEADSRAGEAKAAAAGILRLARQGVPFGKMAVICRDSAPYLPLIRYEFGLAGIPLFCDEPTTPEHTAPAAAVRAALSLLRRGLSTEGLLGLVKSGLCSLPGGEAAACALENYAYTWRLTAADWRAPFTRSPAGYDTGRAGEEAAAQLALAEGARAFVVEAAGRFLSALRRRPKQASPAAAQNAAAASNADAAAPEAPDRPVAPDAPAASDALAEATAPAALPGVPAAPTAPDAHVGATAPTAKEISRQLYFLLQRLGAEEALAALSAALRADPAAGIPAAEEAVREWNVVMELLNQMALLLGDEPTEPAEYDELFSLLLRTTDLGHIPQSLDAVILTTAGRMRLAGPEHCFVLGLAEGEFPAAPGESGLLTHADRDALIRQGIEMPDCFENRAIREQVCFYKALTAPSRGLWLSWPGGTGGLPCSSALDPIVEAFAPPPPALTLADCAATPAAALDALGLRWQPDSPDCAALWAALEQQPAAAPRLTALRRAAQGEPLAVTDRAALAALLGQGLRLSPSRIERYYTCRFAYFLEYVLALRPRRPAELSPNISGSLMHWVLEQALRRHGEGFAALPRQSLAPLAASLVEEYAAQYLPGEGARFRYLLERLKKSAASLLCYLQQDQQQSAFRPEAFEQTIGSGEDAVPPVTLQTPDGRRVQVVGQIDRVDVMKKDGKSYLRVVDYKTGDKQFSLEDVYCGLDCQMLLYLFTLARNGGAKFENPAEAGVLYLMADPPPKTGTREEAAQETRYRLDGLILDDPAVVRGMDSEASGLFVPFRFKADGTPRSAEKLASLEKLGRIRQHIDTLVLEMAQDLYNGKIEAAPLCKNGRAPCTYCDWRSVCRHEDGRQERAMQAPAHPFEAPEPDETTKEATT